MSYQNLKTEVTGAVGIATLNRPEALNALSTPLLNELADALEAWDRGTEVRCIIITGSERAFAAGADIKEMQPKTYSQMYRENLFGDQFDRIARIKKPIIAAVAGHALGGGCELALACDFVIAADTAKFGQPEITLGIMPGLGGSQRLTRIVGKSKAMDLCLTGRVMDAAEGQIHWSSRYHFRDKTGPDVLTLQALDEKPRPIKLEAVKFPDRTGTLNTIAGVIATGQIPIGFSSGEDNLGSLALVQTSILSASRGGDWTEISEVLG